MKKRRDKKERRYLQEQMSFFAFRIKKEAYKEVFDLTAVVVCKKPGSIDRNISESRFIDIIFLREHT